MAVTPGLPHLRGEGLDKGITVLVLNEAAIASLNLLGGATYRWVRSKMRRIEIIAKAKLVPGRGYRTGELQRSVGSSTTPAGRGVVGNVRATAKHAYWYHEGNGGRGAIILPHHPQIRDAHGRVISGGLAFRSRGRKWNLPAVHGYDGHPFLTEAMDEVLDRVFR